jgi:VanZ family protein
MPRIIHYLNAYLPPILWALLIFFFSSQRFLPGIEVTVLDFIFKKSAHMFVYFVLYLLLHRAVAMSLSDSNQLGKSHWHWFIPLVITLAYAISDEFHQALVPGRSATLRDVGYDMIGAGIAFLKRHDYI